MNNTGHKNQDQSSANKNESRASFFPPLPRSPTMKPGHVSGLFLPGPIESGLVSGPCTPSSRRKTVGIYDGFSGPDPPDYLLNNLYTAVLKELKGLLWNDKLESDDLGSYSEINEEFQSTFEHDFYSG
ncbi:unnamed protein product, partial [Brassica rapa subsp. narinosa]